MPVSIYVNYFLAPTVDEIVLSSLNRIANLIMDQKHFKTHQFFVFDIALDLYVFETIFHWNFLFTGSDLEAFKTKELQFYDLLIGFQGKLYLKYKGVSDYAYTFMYDFFINLVELLK